MMCRVKTSFLPSPALFPVLHQVLLNLSPLEKGNVASSDLQPTGNLCSRGLIREAKFIKATLEAWRAERQLSASVLLPLHPTFLWGCFPWMFNTIGPMIPYSLAYPPFMPGLSLNSG